MPLYSQPEFKISVIYIDWGSPNSSYDFLKINIKISNIGDVSGQYKDLKGIGLFSTHHNSTLSYELVEIGCDILNFIEIGRNIVSYLTFYIPTTANGITLKINNKDAGDEKFLTDSYIKYSENVKSKIRKPVPEKKNYQIF